MSDIDRSDTSRTNSTPYQHPQETNLLNLHKAMEYNGQGQPVLRSQPFTGPGQQSAFNEPLMVALTPRLQLDSLYGLPSNEFETFTASTGSATTERDMFKVSTGTSVGGYGVIRSRRLARYRPGQGLVSRFTASFTTPVANTTQRAGFISQEQSLVIGFDGTKFGILRQNDGKAVLQTLTLTVGANGAGETATITLNGASFTASLTNSTIAQNCVEIAAAVPAGWLAEQVDNQVQFFAASNGPKNGTYSFTSTSAAAGTFVQQQAGVADVNDWVYQEDFNVDKLDGTGTSGVTIDFTKLNIFQINFRWLGAGELRFAIENPNTGDLMFFHRIQYANRNTEVSLDNPSFRMGYVAANLSAGSVPDLVVRGGSFAAFIEGMSLESTYPSSISGSHSGLSSNTWHHMLTIKNPLIFFQKVNLKNFLLERVSMAYQGNDPLELALVLNGTPNAPLLFNKIDAIASPPNISGYYSTTTATFTNPITTYITIVNINGGANLNLIDLHLELPPQGCISMIVRSTQNISKATVSMVWNEI